MNTVMDEVIEAARALVANESTGTWNRLIQALKDYDEYISN